MNYTHPTLESVKRAVIEAALARCNGCISKAAAQLEISERTIRRAKRQWAIDDARLVKNQPL